MNNLPHARSYHDLLVYQKARQLAQEVFRVTSTFPKEEMFSLTDQIRRSSRSIGAQIAEAWAKRRYERHFLSKLTDADGEQQETQHWIETALDCGYITVKQAAELKEMCKEIGRLLGGMMAKANLFCGEPTKILRESVVEYLVNDEQ
ncbi:MAG: four helix bundle protein [Anaerolineae bacterium]|nr:four helix bundle protein [Anaerolineales bacterium]MCQ3973861.1 four helix bundle protein [Anaerolineae bacterium]